MGKPGKAVNRAEIPSELWRNSESSLKVLWKLMRVMWVRMSEEMGDDQMPDVRYLCSDAMLDAVRCRGDGG